MYNQLNKTIKKGIQMALEELRDIEVHSVAEVIDFVKANAMRVFHTNTNSMSLYRGQSDYTWHLMPAVYRGGQFEFESTYIKELERIRPSDFAGQNKFDKLVKMQHYGLPTRLLDVTSNPLVALYFACSNHLEKDGAFYYFSTPTFWYDNWAVQIVMEYVMSPENYIDRFVARVKHMLPEPFRKEDEAKGIVMHTLGVPAHAVLPKHTNQRIRQQSGAFFLFGMSFEKEDPNNRAPGYIPYRGLYIDQEMRIAPIIKKLRIPAQYKASILDELDLLNINEAFLFPELEYQSKNVVQSVQRKISYLSER